MKQFLTYIDSLLHGLFRRIELTTFITTRQLACFRVFYGMLLLLYFLPSWSWIKDIPPTFFDPHLFSFAYITNNYPPHFVYVMCDVLVIILLLAITLGIYARKALLLMFVLSSILFSYTFSFGKIDHYTNLFLFTYPILAFTNSGSKLAILKDNKIHESIQARALAIMGIIVAFGFFSAGLAKCFNWIDFNSSTNGFLYWFYDSYFNYENQYLLAPYVFKLPHFVFESLDYLAAIFEISGFLFLLKGKKYWIFYVTIASFFHLINLLVLNMGFTMSMLCYGIFIIAPVIGILYEKLKTFYTTYLKFLFFGFLLIAILKIIYTVGITPLFNYHDQGTLLAFEHFIDILLWLFTISCGIYLLRLKTPSEPTFSM